MGHRSPRSFIGFNETTQIYLFLRPFIHSIPIRTSASRSNPSQPSPAQNPSHDHQVKWLPKRTPKNAFAQDKITHHVDPHHHHDQPLLVECCELFKYSCRVCSPLRLSITTSVVTCTILADSCAAAFSRSKSPSLLPVCEVPDLYRDVEPPNGRWCSLPLGKECSSGHLMGV